MSYRLKKVTTHIQHYLPLLGILSAGTLGFVIFSYDRVFQASTVLATAVAYVVWGIVHHYIHRDLHLSVFIEYIAVAALGVAIIFSLLFRV